MIPRAKNMNLKSTVGMARGPVLLYKDRIETLYNDENFF